MELDKKNIKKILSIIFAAILFYWILQDFSKITNVVKYIWSLILPLIVGIAVAFILNVPMRYIEKQLFNKNTKMKKLKRPAAFLITLLMLIAIIVFVFGSVIPQFIATFRQLAVQIQQNIGYVQDYWEEMADKWPQIQGYLDMLNIEWSSIAKNFITLLQNSASSLFNSSALAIGGIINSLMTFFIGFVFSIYILFQKEKLSVQIKKVLYALIPEKKADRLFYIAEITNKTFSNFLSGQCMEACILGMLFFITMTILRMPYAVLMGVIIAVTALIPIFGAFIGGATGCFLIVMQNPIQAVAFLIMFLVLQQIEGNLIYPHVVGGSIGLPSMWVFAAVVIGGNLMGVLGMIIFIPLASVLYTLLREYILKKLSKIKLSGPKWEEPE